MGFFDLFRKKPALDTSYLVIDLTESGLDINGTEITLPTDIKALTYLLGSPRKAKLKDCDTFYVWDKLGLYSYSSKARGLFCIGVRMCRGMMAIYTPDSDFSGIFTINGKNWAEAMKSGETEYISLEPDFPLYFDDKHFTEIEELSGDIPVSKHIEVGAHSIVSEFSETGDESSALMNIEVQLK